MVVTECCRGTPAAARRTGQPPSELQGSHPQSQDQDSQDDLRHRLRVHPVLESVLRVRTSAGVRPRAQNADEHRRRHVHPEPRPAQLGSQPRYLLPLLDTHVPGPQPLVSLRVKHSSPPGCSDIYLRLSPRWVWAVTSELVVLGSTVGMVLAFCVRGCGFDGIGHSEMVFGEMRPRIRQILSDIRLTVGENLGKNPTRRLNTSKTRFRSAIVSRMNRKCSYAKYMTCGLRQESASDQLASDRTRALLSRVEIPLQACRLQFYRHRNSNSTFFTKIRFYTQCHVTQTSCPSTDGGDQSGNVCCLTFRKNGGNNKDDIQKEVSESEARCLCLAPSLLTEEQSSWLWPNCLQCVSDSGRTDDCVKCSLQKMLEVLFLLTDEEKECTWFQQDSATTHTTPESKAELRNLSTPTKCYFENDERDSKRTRMTRRDLKDKCNEYSERERQLVLFISSSADLDGSCCRGTACLYRFVRKVVVSSPALGMGVVYVLAGCRSRVPQRAGSARDGRRGGGGCARIWCMGICVVVRSKGDTKLQVLHWRGVGETKPPPTETSGTRRLAKCYLTNKRKPAFESSAQFLDSKPVSLV
ncbi:hypothetical protein ANN_11252 [Periplaneta americana]|uniref:Uncharacterized protein n=1 Tax=Periplaneta americana TaxID=6978 RepID=A0ABQ8T668_PERAM|nr:hypothetical protein ANN_11252 [Periplaneta americana]